MVLVWGPSFGIIHPSATAGRQALTVRCPPQPACLSVCCADKKRAGIRDGLCVVVGRRGIVLSASVAGE
jgi:hypothetical protein